MEEIDPEYLKMVLKTLMQAVARERAENYALRLVLAESKIATFPVQDEARRRAAKRYAALFESLGVAAQLPNLEDPQPGPDYLDLLRAFEGPKQ